MNLTILNVNMLAGLTQPRNELEIIKYTQTSVLSGAFEKRYANKRHFTNLGKKNINLNQKTDIRHEKLSSHSQQVLLIPIYSEVSSRYVPSFIIPTVVKTV